MINDANPGRRSAKDAANTPTVPGFVVRNPDGSKEV